MQDPGITAATLLDALDARRQIPLLSDTPGFGMDAALAVAAEVRRIREARGARVVGRKIGFTNRTIWEEYGVGAPIWGPVYDTTCAPLSNPFAAALLVEPRIEPEIILLLSRAPRVGMDDDDLMGCVDGVSLGFELVQSLLAGWRFRASDTVAAFALHGALLCGPFATVAPGRADDWKRRLATFSTRLFRNGAEADRGHAENVLGGGPLAALRHLVAALENEPDAPPLAPGEIVSTGTLTRALTVAPGDEWRAEVAGLDLPPASLRIV